MTKQGGWPATGFAGRLRSIREQAGLSQRELAERAGCNVFTLSKLERGTQEPAWPLVLALARALGVTCEAFQPAGDEPAEESPKPRGRPRKANTSAETPASKKGKGKK
jgi:transcriptional regulator with XRE-family HTH domain